MAARHEEIAEELRRAIDREDYTVGSLLPAETGLAAHYGVSRGTVRFPGEVAALLLLDPYHEDNTIRMPQRVLQTQERMRDHPAPEPSAEIIEMFRALFAQKLAEWPQAVREPLIEHHLAHGRTGMREMENLDEVGDELRHAADVSDAPDTPEVPDTPEAPEAPLIVLSVLGHDPARAAQVPEDLEGAINDVKLALHAELAGSAPGGLHRVLDDAGHNWMHVDWMHVDRSDAVLRAVRDLLERP